MGLDTVSNPYPPTPPRYVPISLQRSRDQDECFCCRGRGHWSSNCPYKTPKRSPSATPGSSASDSFEFPLVRCPCGGGSCPVRTSRTPKNFQRQFIACPADQSKGQCGFFIWRDEIKEVPICGCGAGTCSLNRTNEGKWYFACRIKKNHGACSFFLWADDELNSVLNKKKHSEKKGLDNTGNTDLHNEEVNSNYPVNAIHSDQGVVPDRDLVVQDADSNPIPENELQVFQPKPIAQAESLSFRELRRDPSVAAVTTRVIDAEDEDMSGIKGSSPAQTPWQDIQVFNGFHLGALALNNPSKKQDNDALSKLVFNKLAQSLLDILEDMGPHDPDQMSKIAEAIFCSLQKLSNESGPFIQAIKDYIHNISKLNSIEGSMHNRLSSQELMSLCEKEKARLNNSSGLHSEALAAYRASEIQRQSLQEEILRRKGELIRLEEQLLCCEAETSTHKARSEEASKEMLEIERSLQDVTVDLAETLALEHQLEVACNAARDAFAAAKVWVQ